MRPEDLELFCANLECGTAVVHTGVLSHATTKQHRRLQYTGILELSGGVVVHQYMCPVCSTKRLFGNEGSGFEEVPYESVRKIENAAAILGLMSEVLEPNQSKEGGQGAPKRKKSWLDRLIE